VISTSWEIFKVDSASSSVNIPKQLSDACLGQTPNVLQFVAEMLKNQGDTFTSSILVVLSLCFLPISVGGQLFLQLGQARLLLNIARGDQAQIADLYSGGRYFWRYLGATILFGLM